MYFFTRQFRNSFLTGILSVFVLYSIQAQQGNILPTDNTQKNFLKTYKLVLDASNNHYRGGGSSIDTELFPDYGEFSVYWNITGDQKGSFILPNSIPSDYSSLITSTIYSNYNWESGDNLSLIYQRETNSIAIFQSKYQANGSSISWEALQFTSLFESYLHNDVFYIVNEDSLVNGLKDNTRLLIIPAFTVKDDDQTFYIDSLFSVSASFKSGIDNFLANGGTIYTEGNAAYFIEKLNYLSTGTINFSGFIESENDYFSCTVTDQNHPVGFAAQPTDNNIYGKHIPQVNSGSVNSIITIEGNDSPIVFSLGGTQANGGSVICNLGLPTVSGLAELENNNRQLQWSLNAILSAFVSDVDVTRSVHNDLAYLIPVGRNAISYDRVDTFEIRIQIRNLSSETISGITITENIPDYFSLVDVTSGDAYTQNDNSLLFEGISMNAQTEKIITYVLRTPDPDSDKHEKVDNYLADDNMIISSLNSTTYNSNGRIIRSEKNKDYAQLLFSARIFADTDVNWKNFLGLEYQPFKVFMIMENKARTSAENVEYIQYIPKDVPFYWVDHGLNIPILKTPGGKFVDLLKGSISEASPEYDMDSDGHPDAWLDTTTIYPKGYQITEEEVYWANPWNHLRTGDDSFVFEDIDRDGIVPEDTDGDGVVDIHDEDDKIRVYKVTWDVGRMEGYEYYDPYCSYEIWVDPPDLVPLAAGVGYAHDSSEAQYPGMFYPYTSDINSADLSDTSWTHWMKRNADGSIMWKQLIQQKINNYMGYAFMDTSSTDYHPLPTDSVLGTVPQPMEEFIAVLSLGGEEIDMTNPTPTQSLYSKVNYETIFGEERTTPIRTTYTYYAPLPNPLQFEYLSNNYHIIDTLGNTIQNLPADGKAHLIFDMDASTEYTYYWIRNVGYDVDYNDPSGTKEGVDELGDGAFGYFIYEIPKGMGGYRITLPRNEDGSYNIDSIVKIDDQPFSKWIDNPNTGNEVEIWETSFSYQVYIPQLLIPPALDDDNFDDEDDWIDDLGDRFCSSTGFLHDAFMLDDGEDWLGYPTVPFQDDIYGMVDSGWYAGADDVYGDDYFETLGKTHIQIHADYTGTGREGSVEISKGGILVVEEIFGGSPWVIFSHVMSGFAQGIEYNLTSTVSPSIVKFGIDTICIKHVIEDENEPHEFDINFDPYHLSYGYGDATITTYVGAKDPCSLIEPVINMPAILDPAFDNHSVTLIPLADPENDDLAGYPKSVSGTFVEVRIEVMNGTENNWINTIVTPELPSELGSTEVIMSYVAYPRPLVPSHVDASGNIVSGDQPGTFTTGWRFNQPEGEVLVKMGNTLNLLQPTRRAYFVFLLKVDPGLENNIYEIPFRISGSQKHYKGTDEGEINYIVPDAKFSIVDKSDAGVIEDYEELILDYGKPQNLLVTTTSNFESLGNVKWSVSDVDNEDFASLNSTLEVTEEGNNVEIDLTSIGNFPKLDTTRITILQQGIVDSYNTSADQLLITQGQQLNFQHQSDELNITSGALLVKPVGPRVKVTNEVYRVNGVLVEDTIMFNSDEPIFVETLLTIKNTGSDVSSNTTISINPGPHFEVVEDSLPDNCSLQNGLIIVSAGMLIPGENTTEILPFLLVADDIPENVDLRTVINSCEINYEGTAIEASFNFTEEEETILDVFDLEIIELTYSILSDNQVELHVTAGNRGSTAHNVWLRIYPIIGHGTYEFPVAEMMIDSIETLQTIYLSGTYTLPQVDKAIQFIAIVDDNKTLHEVSELNNQLITDYEGSTAIVTPENEDQFFNLYPNPVLDEVHLPYNLNNPYDNVSVVIFDMGGKKLMELSGCPNEPGQHHVVWRLSDLDKGMYVYKIIATSSENEPLIQIGKLVKE